MCGVATLWVGGSAAALVDSGGALSAPQPPEINLSPGQDIQAIVEDAPKGTRFLFEPGIYRQQTIHPKDQQEFVGQHGVILSGAMKLRTWTKTSTFWRSELLPPPLPFHGECEDGQDLCKRREDLFVSGRLYQRVDAFDDMASGTWYRKNRRAYLADDPSGQLVELGVTPVAFGGNAENVVLKDLIVEKYASDAQDGAIFADEARGWLISNVIARWNHGVGLSFGSETHVEGGSFSHNGQLGIAGSGGKGSRIEGVEIAFNNYAGYDSRWEAGGTKFWETRGLIVRNSCIHHNAGPGLWTDHDNIGTIYDGNRVFHNKNEGIKHEISYDAMITNNIVSHNGTDDNWLWGSQILIQNSGNVNVRGNLVEVASKFGNGISVIHQDRGEGAYGSWDAINNLIHENTIVHLGSRGQNGIVTDTDDAEFWIEAGNDFDRNTYIVADERSKYWTSKGRDANWNHAMQLGLERSGELVVERRTPLEPSCD
jgi:parallel beta-helix repeat protein